MNKEFYLFEVHFHYEEDNGFNFVNYVWAGNEFEMREKISKTKAAPVVIDSWKIVEKVTR